MVGNKLKWIICCFVLFTFLVVIVLQRWLEKQDIENFRNYPDKMENLCHLHLERNFMMSDLKCLEYCDQESPQLVRLVRDHFLKAPPGGSNYNFKLKYPELYGQIGQPKLVDSLLQQKENGFFIEFGADNGEDLSNSLLFELKRNWTGLLVEANDDTFQSLEEKNRQAFLLNNCISDEKKPKMMSFVEQGTAGVLYTGTNSAQYRQIAKEGKEKLKQCFPLYTVLLALGNPTVDYFSLDVEGTELPILRTIPWSNVTINTMTVEFNNRQDDKAAMIKLLEGEGYIFIKEINKQDLVFVHKRLQSKVDYWVRNDYLSSN